MSRWWTLTPRMKRAHFTMLTQHSVPLAIPLKNSYTSIVIKRALDRRVWRGWVNRCFRGGNISLLCGDVSQVFSDSRDSTLQMLKTTELGKRKGTMGYRSLIFSNKAQVLIIAKQTIRRYCLENTHLIRSLVFDLFCDSFIHTKNFIFLSQL